MFVFTPYKYLYYYLFYINIIEDMKNEYYLLKRD